jgi:hypothetical protein
MRAGTSPRRRSGASGAATSALRPPRAGAHRGFAASAGVNPRSESPAVRGCELAMCGPRSAGGGDSAGGAESVIRGFLFLQLADADRWIVDMVPSSFLTSSPRPAGGIGESDPRLAALRTGDPCHRRGPLCPSVRWRRRRELVFTDLYRLAMRLGGRTAHARLGCVWADLLADAAANSHFLTRTHVASGASSSRTPDRR